MAIKAIDYLVYIILIAFGALLFTFIALIKVFGMDITELVLQIYPIIFSGIIATATLFLVKITDKYAESTAKILDEQKKSRQITYIEKKLEKLYYPLKDVLSNPIITHIDRDTLEAFEEIEWKKVVNIIPFQYLAYKESEDILNNFINKILEFKRTGTLSFENVRSDKIKEIKEIKEICERDIEKCKIELNKLIDK